VSASLASIRYQLIEPGKASERCLVRLAPLPAPGQNKGEARLRRRDAQRRAGRTHAAQLLASLGATRTDVASAADGSPVWPEGFVGSITHTDRMIGVAVAPRDRVRSVGIDLERVIEEDVACEVESLCLVKSERDLVIQTRMSHALFTTLCFSAKEALYKCLCPLVGCFFDFGDVEIVELDERTRTLRIKVLNNLNREFSCGLRLCGSFRFEADHVFTIFELPADTAIS
jgi:enterobactin synthetase component D